MHNVVVLLIIPRYTFPIMWPLQYIFLSSFLSKPTIFAHPIFKFNPTDIYPTAKNNIKGILNRLRLKPISARDESHWGEEGVGRCQGLHSSRHTMLTREVGGAEQKKKNPNTLHILPLFHLFWHSFFSFNIASFQWVWNKQNTVCSTKTGNDPSFDSF